MITKQPFKELSIILVDDHTLFRQGLSMLLSNLSYIKQVTEASNGSELLSLIEKEIPDLIFMDIEMPVMNGIEATTRALEKHPELNIVGLSMYGDEDYYSKMISAGAKGFLLKNSGIKEVEMAIQQVVSGNNYFSQEILNGLVQVMFRKPGVSEKSELSEREEEVLYFICKGLSNQEIADKLFISKRTVDKHRENLLLKTDSKNTAGLVIFAIKHGIAEI